MAQPAPLETVAAWLENLNRPVLERLERIEVLLRTSSTEDRMDSTQAAFYLRKVHADGSPNLDALKAFLCRTPSFPREKIGRRLVFSKVAIDAWTAENKGRKAA